MAKVSENRKLVYEILLELERSEQKADVLLHAVLDKYDYLEQRDKAFIKRLTEGCIERKQTLDYVISRYAKTKNGRVKPAVRILLCMGIYQIMYMEGVPDAAACNEAVSLAVEKGLGGLKGFVNGVLRTVSREKAQIAWPEEEKQFLSVFYSMPEWIVERFLAAYGREQTEQMLAAYQSGRPLTLRVCAGHDAAALQKEWEAQGITVKASPYLPGVFQLENVPGVERLAGFSEGAFTIQDVSSMLAVYAADIHPGDTVVDVCAAPGGKSMLAAELCGEKGRVYAFDLTDFKVEKIRENAERLHLAQLTAEVHDARAHKAELEGSADVVIADLPCSGLGVLGRKADIRYRVQPQDILSLQSLQREILTEAIRYLKPGGTLLYSTCTVSREENEDNRDWLLKQFALEPVSIRERLPEAIVGDTAEKGAQQILCGFPKGQPLLDGFFISVFHMRQEA